MGNLKLGFPHYLDYERQRDSVCRGSGYVHQRSTRNQNRETSNVVSPRNQQSTYRNSVTSQTTYRSGSSQQNVCTATELQVAKAVCSFLCAIFCDIINIITRIFYYFIKIPPNRPGNQPQIIVQPTIHVPEVKKPFNENRIELSENPKMTYNKNFMLADDSKFYGGKIYVANLSDKRRNFKMIQKHQKTEMEAEIKIMSCLTHPNIADIFFKFDTPDDKFMLITEDLGSSLSGLNGSLVFDQKVQIMSQLADVVAYLQKKMIVHLEICPQNVYINNYSDRPIAKLINFHKAQVIKMNCKIYNAKDFIEGFTAPEIIQNDVCYLSSDIYSLGCLFFFIITENSMFQIRNINQGSQVTSRINGAISNKSTSAILCKDLISKMLIAAEQLRISVNEVKLHPFFWSIEKQISLVIDISKMIEKKDSQFNAVLFKGGKRVIGDDWLHKLEEDAVQALQNSRLAHQPKLNANQDELYGKSIVSLVRIIRNHLVHDNSEEIVAIMGKTDEELMTYWNEKFPSLILHLYKSKIDYDNNKENINECNGNNNINNTGRAANQRRKRNKSKNR